MRTLLLFAVLVGLAANQLHAQFPEVTLRQIQEVPLDSLLLADTLQNTVPARWTLQASPLYRDTVTVTALCAVPGKILTFTQAGYAMLLLDTTAASAPWGGIFVRVGQTTDTSQSILDGFLNVERGDIIRMTGWVDEFPGGSMNSVTQFVPVPGVPIDIIGSAPVPDFEVKTNGEFYQGLFPNGRVRYSTGEPYEALLVSLVTPLTVDARVNAPRGTFSVVDNSGNQITNYDASRFFTLGHGGSLPFPGDSIWAVDYPVVGSRVTTLRGFMTTVSGSENPRGYRVAPIYRDDVEVGLILPNLSQHRRNPVVVSTDSAARVSVRATVPNGGTPIDSVHLLYSVNNAPFILVPMTFQAGDTTYNAQIPPQAEDSFVKYFIALSDTFGNTVKLASSAFGGASSDTSQGFFFYTVLNRPLTIRDIQQTPFQNGRSPYIGARVSVGGIVTADTAHLNVSPLNVAGTNTWYMQSGNQPWSGIWFVPSVTDSLTFLKNGDSVTVTGTVAENFEVTRLEDATVAVRSAGNPVPQAVNVTTGTFGPTVGNGTPSAEQYEGMLIRVNTVSITDLAPVFSDPTEFEINDGTGPMLVRRDGTHNFSNVQADTLLGRTILKLNDRVSTLTGVLYYSFNRYKLEPRDNNDWGTVTDVEIDRSPLVPDQFSLRQNYPNPFNPATIIEYSLPKAERVTLRIYNLLGQEVRTLVDDLQSGGTYTVRFDASSMATGVYFYVLRAGEFHQVKRMLLLK